jgi:tetratricopeptide (TPR) repeat protein
MAQIDDRILRIETTIAEIGGELRKLRQLAGIDHGSALNKVRYVTEMVLRRLCEERAVSWGKGDPTIESMVGPLVAHGCMPRNVSIHVRTIQANASPGSHFQSDPLSNAHVQIAQLALVDLLEWYYRQRGQLADAPDASGAQAPRPSVAAPRGRRGSEEYVRRALDEYDRFYNEEALSSLRAAIRISPQDPLPHAYLVLLGRAPRAELDAAAVALRALLPSVAPERHVERKLCEAALRLALDGPAAAAKVLGSEDVQADPSLAFWKAELSYAAASYADAELGYRTLLAMADPPYLGRIVDHHAAVLLFHHKPVEAVEIGRLYAEAFPGEADALGVQATTLAAAGRRDEALRLAQEAVGLRDHEDTWAGLGKVQALRGELADAAVSYERSLRIAGDERRALRRAALAWVQWLGGRAGEAQETLAPGLPGGAEAAAPEAAAVALVAGLCEPARIPALCAALDALAASARKRAPQSVRPDLLARQLRAVGAAGAGLGLDPRGSIAPPPGGAEEVRRLASAPWAGDFRSSYHLPFVPVLPWLVSAGAARAAGAVGDALEVLERGLAAYPDHALLLLELAACQEPAARAVTLARLREAWATADPSALPLRRAGELEEGR